MALEQQEQPEFAIAMRGYDRTQVDDYVARLREYAIELEGRTSTAEADAASSRERVAELRTKQAEAGGGTVPDRLAHILSLAEEEASEMKARATSEVERILRDAKARKDHVEAEITNVTRTRDGLLERLAEFREHIDDAIEEHRSQARTSEETQRLERPSGKLSPKARAS